MKVRIVIITGANSGIGKAAAVKFAMAGHQVIMACRSSEKSRKAREEVVEASGNESVSLMELDVSSFDSIRSFCREFKESYQHLDVLIHNAGYFNHGIKTYQLSPDNLELTFATNAFGPLLMTELLRDHLEKSDDARVLSAGTSNIKHFFDPKRKIEFDNLQGEFRQSRPYTVYKMYGDSKMGLLLLTYKMASEYRKQRIKVNSIMIPAVKVSQDTLNKLSLYYRILGRLIQNINPYSLTPEQMAENYYQICISERFRQVTGALISSELHIIPTLGNQKPPSGLSVLKELWNTKHVPAYAADPQNIDRMWEVSNKVISRTLKQGNREKGPGRGA